MIKKHDILYKIINTGVVAVVRAKSSAQARKIAEACMAGGVKAIEITFTVPGAHRVLEELSAAYTPDEIVLGAGTILDPETARVAILSGAQFIVTPHLDLEVMKICNRYQVPVMPGATTVKDALTALEAGAEIIKVFPGELFGPKIIKALKGPLPYGNFMPTGGVDSDNIQEWIRAGSVAVGVGGSLTGLAVEGDYSKITAKAHELVAKVQAQRSVL